MPIPQEVIRRLQSNSRLSQQWIDGLGQSFIETLKELDIELQEIVFFPHGRGGLTCKTNWNNQPVILKLYDDPKLVQHELSWHRYWGRVQSWETDNPHLLLIEYMNNHPSLRESTLPAQTIIERTMQEVEHWQMHRPLPAELAPFATNHQKFIPDHIERIMKPRALGLNINPPYELWEKAVKAQTVTLLHGDFSPANILYNSSSDHMIFIDPGMMAGDPMYDWAKFIIHLQRHSNEWGNSIYNRIDQIAQGDQRENLKLWINFFIHDRIIYYHDRKSRGQAITEDKLKGWHHMLRALENGR